MAVAQSSIGVQLFYWNIEHNKFEYYVPITGDLPPMGGSPNQIEVTETDSPVKQYISDRPDNPEMQISYNYLVEHEVKINEHLDSVVPHNFLILLPLKSAFVFEATGSTWFEGGNPEQGTISFSKSKEEIKIKNIADVLSADEISLLGTLGITATETQKLEDLIDFTTVDPGKINHKDAQG